MMKSFFLDGRETIEEMWLPNALPALKKNRPTAFIVAWTLSSFFASGDISSWSEPLSVEVVPLNVDVGARIVGPAGALVYRGGVELTSEDPRFGGLSGLLAGEKGRRMLAISDNGWWLQGKLIYNERGDLAGVQEVSILPMRSLEPSVNFTLDAEALIQTGDGGLIVAYERQHRIWSYRDVWSNPTPISMGGMLSKLPLNSGIEALVLMAPGELLAITETGTVESNFAAFHKTEGGISRIEYPYHSYFRPSDAVRIASNSLLVLERGYNKQAGVGARLVLIQARAPIGKFEITGDVVVELGSPIPLDNFEGLAIVSRPSSPAQIYLLSDDNYSSSQRTLLMMFDLEMWR